MLTIYHSNQPEIFKKILIDIMSDEVLSDPMQSEIILIENKIMIEWIQVEVAKHFGIAANIMFMDISSFIRMISDKISPKNFTINDFNCAVLYWQFMEILPKLCSMQHFSIIERYLHDDCDKRKCGQLSEKLVELFTKYLIYRTDWLDNWKSNKMIDEIIHPHQLWQAELWRILLKSLQDNNVILYENVNYLAHCVHLLKNLKKIDNNFFPKRIFIFGITLIPAIYWKILNLVSNYIDIYVWFFSPYYRFNYNCIVNKNLLKITSLNALYTQDRTVSTTVCTTIVNNGINDFVSVDFNEKMNHILINFCGLVGKNTLWLLTKLENLIEKKVFVVPQEDSLLHILQKNILEWQEYITINKEKYNIKKLKNQSKHLLELQDQSITVHICYSIQREIEVLHDNLLSMIQKDPLLLQKGIIVMAPDICDYTMAIKTVFDNIYGRSLPFNIASNYTKCIHPIISAVLNILSISYSRCTSEEILSFLKISLIANKFNIKEEELKLLNQWVIKSGIKWGLDDTTMYNFNFPKTYQNTWYFGLNRMLLGHAIHNSWSVWEDISPYNDFNNVENIKVVGYLGEFLQVLRKWRDKFSHSHTIIEWMSYMQEMLDDFFDYSDANVEENKIFYLLKSCWRNILDPGIQSGYSELINIIVLRDKLSHKLNQNVVNFKFLPNVINFCNISPICCVSCQIICFLGMNKDAFPRKKIPTDFDLMIKNPRSDDHHVYDGDCYFFLLGLLLAKERVYISFIENSIDDCIIDNASVLIHVLFEHITHSFYLLQDKYADNSINAAHIRNHLMRRYNRVPFAYEHFILGSKMQSFANEWVSSINIHTNNFGCDFVTPLPKIIINTVSFYDLYNFYRHPIKVWFQKRLGVYFKEYMSIGFNVHHHYFDDCCSLNELHQFNLNVNLLNYLIYNNDINEFYNSVRAAGILPYGTIGEIYWLKQYLKMDMLAKKIKIFYIYKKFDLNICLKFDNVTLTGQLTMIQENGLVRWKPAYLSVKDGLLFWLEHVVYCALGGTGDSRLFGVNDTWHFSNLSQFQAKEFLFILISGYLIGINTPLYLLHKSGGAWINQMFNWNNKSISTTLAAQKKACSKLIRAWQGVKYSCIQGEYCDPYLRMLMPYNLQDKDIEKIVKTAEHYFLFPMKYKIVE